MGKKNGFPIWVVPVLITFATGTVWLRLFIIRTTYEISQIESEIEQFRREKDRLQLKVVALRSPRRLEMLARTKFGLSQPRANQVVQLRTSEIGD